MASEVDPETSTYDLRTLEAPVLSGLPLSLFIKAYESLGNAIYGPMSLASGIHQVSAHFFPGSVRATAIDPRRNYLAIESLALVLLAREAPFREL